MASLALLFSHAVALRGQPADPPRTVQLRVINSATGCAVDAAEITLDNEALDAVRAQNGNVPVELERGNHVVQIHSPRHYPLAGPILVQPGTSSRLQFQLDPLELPRELQPEVIAARHRPDTTLFVGFVVDDDSAEPLSDVQVSGQPAGAETRTDARGFFQLHLPVPKEQGAKPASLRFDKPDYQTEERQQLELWPEGDWTLRVRLLRGRGRRVVDERPALRNRDTPVVLLSHGTPAAEARIAESAGVVPPAPPPSNLTLRVPRTIRVLLTNGTIDYVSLETYTRRSLPREWIASWSSFTGGSNSLKAGAVAVRTYAVGYVNGPRGSDHDICATTSCQVYGSTTSTSTDNAANQTAGYVMINSSASIPRGLTEYSSENNSLGFSCGDGYTQPSGGCISDPVCLGETRFGHGRGLCQWGSARWATGLKFPGNDFPLDGSTQNGFARQDWVWILNHYYPSLVLVQGAPLVLGDLVKAASAGATVRLCADGSITNGGVNCPALVTKPAGSTGTIVDGPVQVLSDGAGYTWWKVQWSDGLLGWAAENWLERFIPPPPAPSGLSAMPVATNRIDLSWTDNSSIEEGFEIEQALAAGGPWTSIALVTNLTSRALTNLAFNTTYFFRVHAFNLGGDSTNSNVAFARTPDIPLILLPIADAVINEGATLSFTASAVAPETAESLTDFEGFASGTASGSVLFRQPTFSGGTSSFLDGSPDVASVTNAFPPGEAGARALRVSWSFKTNANAWLRLTTFSAANLPNPVIDFRRRFRFDIFADKDLRVALGLRETTNAPGTPVGANGGSAGGIEWAGVTNQINSQPQPNRLVPAGAWITLTFDPLTEPVRNYTGGNGLLSTASGLGALEHLAFVPAGGSGIYNVYLDNFTLVEPRSLTFTLEPGAPTNASIDAASGLFTWSPTEAEGPGTSFITVRVADNGSPPQSDTKTFKVVVNEVNQGPLFAAVSNRTIHAGARVMLTNSATDPDLPANRLRFSLAAGPPGASMDPTNGLFSWLSSDELAGTSNRVTLVVADNGTPPLSNTLSFAVLVVPRPTLLASISAEHALALNWAAIPGQRYQVQYKVELGAPGWFDLGEIVTASGPSVSILDAPLVGQRFYRIVAVE